MKIKYFLVAAVLATAILCFAGPVKAVDNSALIVQLQAQIAQLIAQLKALQDQQDTTQTWCHTFNANIGMGQKTGNPEVDALVIALQKEGLIDQGMSFEGYDETLASAVTGFQEKYASEILTVYNLKHGTGYVGKSTRAKLNALYGCKIMPKPCAPNWTCGWGECINGYQQQKAVDLNNCNSTGNLPIACPTLTQACTPSTNQPSVTVTSPNGGETWNIGETHRVTWTSQNINSVYIYIDNYSGNLGSGASNYITPGGIAPISAAQGYYDWTISSQQLGSMANAEQSKYKIRVVDTATNSAASPIMDSSNNYFTISKTSVATCIDSDGGINYNVKGTVVSNINSSNDYCYWSNNNVATSILYEFYCEDNMLKYKTYVCPNGCENGACKKSTTQPSITVTSPNGGETWTQGSFQKITWTTNNIPVSNTMTIRLRGDDGLERYIYDQHGDSVAANYGEFTFLVHSNLPVGKYKAEAKTVVNGQSYLDASDNYFSIVAPTTTYCSQWHAKFMASYQKSCGDTAYNPVADVDKDKTVGLTDVGFYAANQTNETWCQQKLSEITSPCTVAATVTTYCNQLYIKIQNSYKTRCGVTLYNPVADVDKDGEIGLGDIAFYAGNQTNETWCQQKLSETTSPCTTSFNANDNSLASISDAIAKIVEQIKAMLNK